MKLFSIYERLIAFSQVRLSLARTENRGQTLKKTNKNHTLIDCKFLKKSSGTMLSDSFPALQDDYEKRKEWLIT